MFIGITTKAYSRSIKSILKLLGYVSVFLDRPQRVHKFCQLKL
jgi:hypothetical protein